MTINERLILLFNKKRAVCITTITKDRRQHIKYAIPNPDRTVDLPNGTISINTDSYVYNGRMVPTYYFMENKATCIDILETKDQNHITSAELKSIANTKVVTDTLNSNVTSNVEKLLPLILFIMIAGFAVIGYLLITELNSVMELLRNVYGSVE